MNRAERRRWDALFHKVVEHLPARLHRLMEEVSVIIDDRPDPELLAELGLDPEEDLLCGLHSGVPLTERSVTSSGDLPDTVHLFREDIVDTAGGWDAWQDEDGAWWGGEAFVEHEIRVTLLHEIGHHFGLDEEDLRQLGYD
ncbi:MAG: metallopeptidase family protein [Phycisphaerales bacterium]|nr:metallopeptidase family protein [Phycisphaerales bacterium]